MSARFVRPSSLAAAGSLAPVRMLMRVLISVLVSVLMLAPVLTAQAHGIAPGIAQDGVAAARWTLDPWIVLPLALALLLYGAGFARLQRRARAAAVAGPRRGAAARRWLAAAYGAGWLALAGALLSPLHWLGERVFTCHMIEHEIVMAVAAPLVVLARPGGVLLWALPRAARRAVGAACRGRAVHGLWRWATQPGIATLLHGLAIWLWHVPAFFDAAIAAPPLHRLQHLSFLVTALLFWWSMLRRSDPGGAVWHLFATMTHTGILGALLTLAPRPLYRLQTVASPTLAAFGFTPLEDQQLAGVVMWLPAATVYAGAALALAALWIRRSAQRAATPATPA